MKIKYRNEILQSNDSPYCIDCAIYQYTKADGTCFGLCCKMYIPGGFNITDDCEVLEL